MGWDCRASIICVHSRGLQSWRILIELDEHLHELCSDVASSRNAQCLRSQSMVVQALPRSEARASSDSAAVPEDVRACPGGRWGFDTAAVTQADCAGIPAASRVCVAPEACGVRSTRRRSQSCHHEQCQIRLDLRLQQRGQRRNLAFGESIPASGGTGVTDDLSSYGLAPCFASDSRACLAPSYGSAFWVCSAPCSRSTLAVYCGRSCCSANVIICTSLRKQHASGTTLILFSVV